MELKFADGYEADYFTHRYVVNLVTGCWHWQVVDVLSGYGHAAIRKKKWRAHRLSWALHNGPIPDGMQVLHRCDVPNCVSPAHLFLGTVADNMQDKAKKGRQRNNRFGSQIKRVRRRAQTTSKLTKDQVREIRSSDETTAALARRFGVGEATVYSVRKGLTWAWLDQDQPHAIAAARGES